MHELFYCSCAKHAMTEKDILDILETSRKVNSEIKVTGILVYYSKTRQFMQILEGEKQTIFDLYQKIQKDKRHASLKLIYDGKIPERSFADWTMGFSNFNSIDKSKLKGYSQFIEKGFTDELLKNDFSSAIKLFEIFKTVLP